MKIKAFFASDIDNTLTDLRHIIPDRVKQYLTHLHKDGWELMFLTGRSYTFAMKALDGWDIPYTLAVQNGAEILEMPAGLLCSQHFLEREILPKLSKIFEAHGEEFFVYSGHQTGDFCYYRPERFSPELLAYLKKLQAITSAPWRKVTTWQEVQDSFPLIKCAGNRASLTSIRDEVLKMKNINVVLMDDAVDTSKSTLLITHEEAAKGKALKRIYQKRQYTCPIVAAGDGNNDFCLLENADIAIAMEDAPMGLKDLADIIAKPAKECGIIEAIENARGMLARD